MERACNSADDELFLLSIRERRWRVAPEVRCAGTVPAIKTESLLGRARAQRASGHRGGIP
jgi:hypothetical protein